MALFLSWPFTGGLSETVTHAAWQAQGTGRACCLSVWPASSACSGKIKEWFGGTLYPLAPLTNNESFLGPI